MYKEHILIGLFLVACSSEPGSQTPAGQGDTYGLDVSEVGEDSTIEDIGAEDASTGTGRRT